MNRSGHKLHAQPQQRFKAEGAGGRRDRGDARLPSPLLLETGHADPDTLPPWLDNRMLRTRVV